MNRTDYNCWIRTDGSIRQVSTGMHLATVEIDDAIRVSMPERRRTWVGIDCYPCTTPEAKETCKRLIRDLRREGLQIIAIVDNERIEVLPHQRPTRLNKALSCTLLQSN